MHRGLRRRAAMFQKTPEQHMPTDELKTEHDIVLTAYAEALRDGDDTRAISLARDPRIGLGLDRQAPRSLAADRSFVQDFRQKLDRVRDLISGDDERVIEDCEHEGAEIKTQIDALQSRLDDIAEKRKGAQDRLGKLRMMREGLVSNARRDVVRAAFPQESAAVLNGDQL